MNKILGYAVMIAGVIIVAAPLLLKKQLTFLAGMNSLYIIVAGIALLVFGFVMTKSSSNKARHSSPEVPIRL